MSKLKFRFIESSFALFLELIKKLNIFSFIIGSKAAFFSLSQSLTPTTGLLCTINSTSIIFAIRTIITICTSNFGFYISLLYHIPTFCGALYFYPKFRNFRFLIPLICLMLFISHPIGAKAYLYSFYWFIPIILAFINPNSIFLQSLASTFTTHAVGSVIWLYTGSLSVEMWLNLISIVWAERLIFATTMTIFYYLAINIKNISILDSTFLKNCKLKYLIST